MEINKEIKIGYGLGNIKFGTTIEDIEKLLGKPDDKERVSYPIFDDEELYSESYHYDEMELSVAFDEGIDGKWQLGTIAISSPEYTLRGKQVINLLKSDLIKTLEELNLGKYSEESVSDDDDSSIEIINFENHSLSFWIVEGICTEIQWGPLFNEDDEPVWPE